MQRDDPERVECQVENGWDLWSDEAKAALTASPYGKAVVKEASAEAQSAVAHPLPPSKE